MTSNLFKQQFDCNFYCFLSCKLTKTYSNQRSNQRKIFKSKSNTIFFFVDKYTDIRTNSKDIAFKVQNEAAYIVLEEYIKIHMFALIIPERKVKKDISKSILNH